jgi:hypothetical protein
VIYRGVIAPAADWRSEIVPISAKTAVSTDVLAPVSPTAGVETRSHNRRISWARLLARIWGVDALRCERCGGRMRVLAALTDPSVVVKILEHLALPSEPPALAPARWPP